jgi:hypothetical protein
MRKPQKRVRTAGLRKDLELALSHSREEVRRIKSDNRTDNKYVDM